MASSSLYFCVLVLSVNIKDTAGCSVLIKQVSVHKQLINKSARPLSRCICLSVPFYDRSGLRPAPWIATSVYYAHSGGSDRHNDTIVTLPHMPRSHLPHDPGVSWHISGSDSIHGNNHTFFLFYITAVVLSVWRMWCHHSDAFRNVLILMVVIIYVL